MLPLIAYMDPMGKYIMYIYIYIYIHNVGPLDSQIGEHNSNNYGYL